MFTLLVLSVTALTAASCSCSPQPTPTSDSSDTSDTSTTSEESVPVSSVTLNKSTLTLEKGASEKLVVTVLPENASNRNVTWTSSSADVTVDQEGNVKAVNVGSAVITAKSVSDPSKTASCTVTVTAPAPVYSFLGPVTKKQSFVDYAANIAVPSTSSEGYFDREQGYSVGDDNPVNVKPVFEIVDENFDPADQDLWDYDFEYVFKVKNDSGLYVIADESLYEVTNNRKGDIKFSESAVGKSFKVSVTPGGLDAEEKADPDNTVTYSFNVIDGYNVYSAKELSYLDDRHGDNSYSWADGDVAGWADQWDAFKEANGLDKTVNHKTLILHQNIQITKDDFPANFLYSEEEAAQTATPEKVVGTFKDYIALYAHQSEDKLTLNGNYFKLDYSQIPLITRGRGGKETGDVNSHSELTHIYKGSFDVRNLNVTGNAPKAIEAVDVKYGGGLMFNKTGHYTSKVSAYNLLARDCFITFMSEKLYTETPLSFDVLNSKFYNNYNCFFYNWAGNLHVKDSIMSKCGGPIAITDHWINTDIETEYEIESQLGDYPVYTPNGRTSHTVFEDCVLDNLVAGSEAWFVQFKLTGLVPQIKTLSDLYYGLGKSYVTDADGKAVAMASAPAASFLNLITVNKSAAAEGATNANVCGSVEIIRTGKSEVFDYSQPVTAELQSAAEIQAGLQSGDQAIIAALCEKYSCASVEELMALAQSLGASYGADATNHALLRGANNLGAPVFECGGEFAYFDGTHKYLQPLSNANPSAPSTDPLLPTSDFITKATDTTTLYYNGMLVLLGVVDVA